MGLALASGMNAKLISLPTAYDAFCYFILECRDVSSITRGERIERYKIGLAIRANKRSKSAL